MLTKKQQELLEYIHKQVDESGVSPSFEEMKLALNLKSKSGIHRLITALVERGFIRRLPNRARALEVIRPPKINKTQKTGFSPNVITGKLANAKPDNDDAKTEFSNIPIMGRIAAGVPIEAIQDHSNDLAIANEMIGTGAHFALEVQGDSMIDDGIIEGDMVVIQKQNTATPGDIVVALVDDEEATLKRFRRNGDSIALEPANKNYETKIYGQDRVEVQGKLIALVRKY